MRSAGTVVHSAVDTICNLVDLETGMPHEVGAELLASGGIEALVGLLPEVNDADAKKRPSETQFAACQALAALTVNPEVGEHIARTWSLSYCARDHALTRTQDGIQRLVELVKAGGARSQIARHAAATLARVARNQPAHIALIREAGGIKPLIDLIADSIDDKWAFTEGDMQAAQHGAGALWILAAEQEAKQAINDHQDARRLLASLLTGKMGKKAEGNAAGALLMLGMPRSFPSWGSDAGSYMEDPVSVVTVTMEQVRVV